MPCYIWDAHRVWADVRLIGALHTPGEVALDTQRQIAIVLFGQLIEASAGLGQ